MSTTFDAYLEFTCADPATQSELWDERIRAIQKYAPLCFDPKLKPVYAQTMSTYQKVLGNVFAMKLVEGDKELVKKIAAYLVEEGASFSITMDYPYTIWLSTHAVGLLGTLDWKTL